MRPFFAIVVTMSLVMAPQLTPYARAQSQAVCLEQARTELENVFCKVKASRHGRSLPNLHDFRRNPPSTQALLLKRPAERLGLMLPKKALPRPSKPKASGNVPGSNTPRTSRLDRICRLEKTAMICQGRRYKLTNNLSNRALSPDALTKNNRLVLSVYQGDLKDSAAVQAYLLSVYPVYLQKMLDIGLGASTMSFTKFFHTFQEVSRLGAPFESRMSSMYEHLKEDKQNIGTQARYGKAYPDELSQCDMMGTRFVVCDDVKHNWVYVLE